MGWHSSEDYQIHGSASLDPSTHQYATDLVLALERIQRVAHTPGRLAAVEACIAFQGMPASAAVVAVLVAVAATQSIQPPSTPAPTTTCPFRYAAPTPCHRNAGFYLYLLFRFLCQPLSALWGRTCRRPGSGTWLPHVLPPHSCCMEVLLSLSHLQDSDRA